MVWFTIRTLDNGIKVALESISYVRSISFGIWVKNGSRNELPQENGVSHYIEHMMFKGTKSRTARQIAEEMDALGGRLTHIPRRNIPAIIPVCWISILTAHWM